MAERPTKLKMSDKEENRILKNAVTRLYNKLLKMSKECENAKNANEQLRKEN